MLLLTSAVALSGSGMGGQPLFDGAIGRAGRWLILVIVLVVATVLAARPWLTRDRLRVQSVRKLVIAGVSLILLAEMVSAGLPQRGTPAVVTGSLVGLLLLGMCGYLGVVIDPPDVAEGNDEVGESLQQWAFRTESLVSWSASGRADWDRRVRPVLARQFEMATKANQRRSTDPESFRATGRMLFGADLWKWVDPDNVVRGGALLPGPGRRTLERIIECLEQV